MNAWTEAPHEAKEMFCTLVLLYTGTSTSALQTDRLVPDYIPAPHNHLERYQEHWRRYKRVASHTDPGPRWGPGVLNAARVELWLQGPGRDALKMHGGSGWLAPGERSVAVLGLGPFTTGMSVKFW